MKINLSKHPEIKIKVPRYKIQESKDEKNLKTWPSNPIPK